jgi:hypothetical protein
MINLRLILKDIASDLFDWALILAMAVGILILSASAPAHAADSEWVEIGNSTQATAYISPARIKATGDGRPSFWVRILTIREGAPPAVVSLWRVDCAAQRIITVTSTGYAKNGDVLGSISQQPEEYILPGSVADVASQIVCQIDKSAAAKSVKAL